MFPMSLIETLVLGSYAFTAGCYAFAYSILKKVDNHRRSELKAHLHDECLEDCYYCREEDGNK